MPKGLSLGGRFLFIVLGIIAIFVPKFAFAQPHALIGSFSYNYTACMANQRQNMIAESVPTPTASPMPTRLPTPTVSITPTISVMPTETLTTNISAQPGDLNADIIFQLINSHRVSMGLPEYQKDDKLCALAQSRRGEITQEAANGNYHAGLYARNLPYWVTENMKYGSDEQGTVDWWLHSPIHQKAIEGNFQYSCGTCVGNVCIELFTSYVPK